MGFRHLSLLGLLPPLIYPFVTWQPLDAVAADLFAVLPLGQRRGAFGNIGPGVYLWLRFELEGGTPRSSK